MHMKGIRLSTTIIKPSYGRGGKRVKFLLESNNALLGTERLPSKATLCLADSVSQSTTQPDTAKGCK
jgi:hypothetical protein